MTLLRDIQDAAAGELHLDIVLRKMLLLAARLSNEELRRWAQGELDGYIGAHESDVPSYRVWPVLVMGTAANGFQERTIQIHGDQYDERVRKTLFTYRFNQGVAALQRLATSESDHSRFPWSQELVDAFPITLSKGWAFTQIFWVVQHSTVQDALSAIRSKALQFAIEIEKSAPDAGEAPPGQPAVDPARVRQVINTTIYGGMNTIAVAGRDASAAPTVMLGPNFDALAEELSTLGVQDSDIEELRAAIVEDHAQSSPAEVGSSKLGPGVRGWIGQLALKSAETGATELTSGATGALLKHLGAG